MGPPGPVPGAGRGRRLRPRRHMAGGGCGLPGPAAAGSGRGWAGGAAEPPNAPAGRRCLSPPAPVPAAAPLGGTWRLAVAGDGSGPRLRLVCPPCPAAAPRRCSAVCHDSGAGACPGLCFAPSAALRQSTRADFSIFSCSWGLLVLFC